MESALWLLSTLLVACSYGLGRRIHSFAGPNIHSMYRIEQCPSEQRMIDFKLRFSHFNPSRPFDLQTMSGNVTIRRPIGNNVYSRVTFASRSNNQWKENALVFSFPKGGCNDIRLITPAIFEMIARITGIPTDDKKPCVIPAGHYTANDEPLNLTYAKFPVLPYGHYQGRMVVRIESFKNPVAACAMGEFKIIPRP